MTKKIVIVKSFKKNIKYTYKLKKCKFLSALFLIIKNIAKYKYNITCVNGTTYNGENKMPYSWYERIGFKKVEDLLLIESNPNDIIDKIK